MRFRVRVDEEMFHPDSDRTFAIDQQGALAEVNMASYLGNEYVLDVIKNGVVMPSLNKLDKNGKEIFVDDIIKAEGIDKLLHLESLGSMEVSIDGMGTYLGAFDPSELKVMGNVYENPELREGAGRL